MKKNRTKIVFSDASDVIFRPFVTDINKMEYGDGQSTSSGDDLSAIDLFSLYVLFSHFRPRDALMGICPLFFFH